jgi:hypothetical protein
LKKISSSVNIRISVGARIRARTSRHPLKATFIFLI